MYKRKSRRKLQTQKEMMSMSDATIAICKERALLFFFQTSLL